MFASGLKSNSFLKLLSLAAVCHVFLGLIAFWIRETADQRSFAYWAHQAYAMGIHRAYSIDGFGYDWLPFYLYVSKLMGAFFELSGLNLVFGPISRALLFFLKLPMIAFNLAISYTIFYLGKIQRMDDRYVLLGSVMYLLNPGIAVATDIYGYQDALHTFLLVMAVLCLYKRQFLWVPVCSMLAFLTKPQAAIFLVPIAYFYLKSSNWKRLGRDVLMGSFTVFLVLLPFIFYGTLHEVWQMYLNVPQIHQWLTGYAHNLWWLVQPVPPFVSDRTPLVGDLNGLTIGLILLGSYVCLALFKLHRNLSFQGLVEVCAFVGFVFFMVTTELHENHSFALFAFAAIAGMWNGRILRFAAILSFTFAINLVTALLTLHNDTQIWIGPIRLATANAAVNGIVLVIWTVDMFQGLLSGSSAKTQA